jgi:hypothetical protein
MKGYENLGKINMINFITINNIILQLLFKNIYIFSKDISYSIFVMC